jgi:uncharacterized protein YciI
MKYFAAFLKMLDVQKNEAYRPQHMDFLVEKEKEGKIFARGRFTEGKGGLVIYIAETFEQAKKLAESDPLFTSGARSLDLYEWDMKVAPNQ